MLGGQVSWLASRPTQPAARGDAPTLVLLHGIPASAELWRGVLDHLGADGIAAIAPDLPGGGRSRLPVEVDHGIEGAADVVRALVEHLGLERVWLVGHDLGGVAAQLLAVDGPTWLAGVTFSHSPIDDAWPPPAMRPVFAAARAGLADRVAPILARSVARGARLGVAGLTGTDVRWSTGDARRVFTADKLADDVARGTFAQHVAAVGRRNDVLTRGTWPRLPDLDVPTQLLWGDADTFQPWQGVGDRLRRQLPSPAVTVVSGAGHFLPGEQPAAVAAALGRAARAVER